MKHGPDYCSFRCPTKKWGVCACANIRYQALFGAWVRGYIMWYYSIFSASMTIFAKLLSIFVDSRVTNLISAICYAWPVCCDLILHWKSHNSQCRSALVAHARPTLFYIPLVLCESFNSHLGVYYYSLVYVAPYILDTVI